MIKQECPVCHSHQEVEDELGLEELGLEELGLVKGIGLCPDCQKKLECGELTEEEVKKARSDLVWKSISEKA